MQTKMLVELEFWLVSERELRLTKVCDSAQEQYSPAILGGQEINKMGSQVPHTSAPFRSSEWRLSSLRITMYVGQIGSGSIREDVIRGVVVQRGGS